MAGRSGTPVGAHAVTLAVIGKLALVVAGALIVFVAGEGGGSSDLRLTAGGPAPAPPNQPPAGEVPAKVTTTTTADRLT